MTLKALLMSFALAIVVTNFAYAETVDNYTETKEAIASSASAGGGIRDYQAAARGGNGGGLDGGGSDGLEVVNASAGSTVVKLAPGAVAAFLSIQSNMPVVVSCQSPAEQVAVVCSCSQVVDEYNHASYRLLLTTVGKNGKIATAWAGIFAVQYPYYGEQVERARRDCKEALANNPACSHVRIAK